jgi:hypothetical protein
MPIPSGLLNGRGCHDSLRKCEDEAQLFLSIRNHGTPFLLEQRKARERLNLLESADVDLVEGEVKERFAAGALPLLRTMVKYLFLIFLFPFQFCFCLLPQVIADKLVKPFVVLAKKVIARLMPPVIKVMHAVYRPIELLCQKICLLCQMMLSTLKPPLAAFFKALAQLKLLLCAPLKQIFQKIHTFQSALSRQVGYRSKVALTWLKLLCRDGLAFVRTFGQQK